MRQFLKSAAKVSAVSAIACALTFVSTFSANAQSKKGLEGDITLAVVFPLEVE